MNDIQIKLSKEQFKLLLELLYLGNTVVNGHRDKQIKMYEDVVSLLFELAPKFGIENFSDDETPQFPSRLFEERMQVLVEEYDEITFWEELINKLSQMMLERDYSLEQLNSMDRIERFKLFFRCEDKVRLHLTEHGITQFPLPEQH